MLSTPGAVYRVATTEDGGVIGCASGGPSRSGYFAENELYAIYLMPGFERRGIGRRLFGSVVRALIASGRKQICLQSSITAVPSRSKRSWVHCRCRPNGHRQG
ncbi:GNAT family N-acetyltransferase [Rhizobium favelukesii]|uniref:GNAT family N-acetyltransferase n=1 Tax=Rhizobium TaxID=379 RepID=UPI000DD4A45F|nr:GNAT family N-acetyltransferase [Rhizobium favelukesii]